MRSCWLLIIVFVVCSAAGCSTTIDHPDAEEILDMNPEADIFQYNGTVYRANIDWVDELSLTTDEQVGEIKKSYETDDTFEDEMATKLPIGTKLYTVKERRDILIAVVSGEEINYFEIVEG